MVSATPPLRERVFYLGSTMLAMLAPPLTWALWVDPYVDHVARSRGGYDYIGFVPFALRIAMVALVVVLLGMAFARFVRVPAIARVAKRLPDTASIVPIYAAMVSIAGLFVALGAVNVALDRAPAEAVECRYLRLVVANKGPSCEALLPRNGDEICFEGPNFHLAAGDTVVLYRGRGALWIPYWARAPRPER